MKKYEQEYVSNKLKDTYKNIIEINGVYFSEDEVHVDICIDAVYTSLITCDYTEVVTRLVNEIDLNIMRKLKEYVKGVV